MRDSFDYGNLRFQVAPGSPDFVTVPTGIAVFANTFVDEGTLPREGAERLYDVRRWTPMPRGGHFAPVEGPDLLARDIAAFSAGFKPARRSAGQPVAADGHRCASRADGSGR